MINYDGTPEEIEAQVAEMFKPSAAQIAEFEYLRAGYFAERRERRLEILKLVSGFVGAIGSLLLLSWGITELLV